MPVELLDRIQDPGGGRSAILSSYGRLMFMIGDGYLFGRDLGKPVERWSFVQPDELQITEDGIAWKSTRGGAYVPLARSTTEAYRMWTPDPEYSGEAESPMRAGIEIADELDLLTKAVKSTATSRMLNGMLKIPQELSFGADEPGLDDDAEANPFLQEMLDHMDGVIENPGTPEGSLPWFAEGAAEYLADLEWMSLHDAQTDYMEKDLRLEAINRLAMGMDLPPEVLKGMAEANHWGARQIMHDTWRTHGSVVAEQFCDDLADAYLRPALLQAGFEDWHRVVIAYDDSQVVVPPDRTDDADKAYDRGNVSDSGYRTMKGISEDDAPERGGGSDLPRGQAPRHLPPQGHGVRGGDARARAASPRPRPDVGQPSASGGGSARAWARRRLPPGVARLDRSRRRGARALPLPRGRGVAHPNEHPQPLEDSSRACADRGQVQLPRRGHPRGEAPPRDRSQPAPDAREDGGGRVLARCSKAGASRRSSRRCSRTCSSSTRRRRSTRPSFPTLPPGFLAQVERLRASIVDEAAVVEQNNDSLARLQEMLPGAMIKG